MPPKDISTINRVNASKRVTFGGPAKKLDICSHCGELLGVRERRQHGDRRIGGSLAAPVQKMEKETK